MPDFPEFLLCDGPILRRTENRSPVRAFLQNYPASPESCVRLQLYFVKQVSDVHTGRLSILAKQACHLLLGGLRWVLVRAGLSGWVARCARSERAGDFLVRRLQGIRHEADEE